MVEFVLLLIRWLYLIEKSVIVGYDRVVNIKCCEFVCKLYMNMV